ncbi:MAG: hypothetical protein L6V83_05610 [Christensenella sp.]|nr:MAG: hypothetical protein L6V83_05610 [Christensenella sp.]
MYCDINALVIAGKSGVAAATQILLDVFSYGLVPMAVTFLLALVMWYICARRHANYISRNDFCYWVMIFVAAVRLLGGVIDCFAVLEPAIYVVTSTVYTVTALPAAMLIMYFCVFRKFYNFNPVERANSFTLYSIVFMVVLGLSVLSQNLTIVSIGASTDVAAELIAYLREMGYVVDYLTAPIQVYSSIVAICIYFAYLIADIVIAAMLKKQASEFRNTDTREDYLRKHPEDQRQYGYTQRNDTGDTFGEFEKQHVKKKDDEHVFDEFDI